ncbi:pyrroloquinoline quinone precursor peptide PqqA [Actinomadura rubrisoli]|uniref:Coenzyme PQQ synthesis protein A n=1 Tax=Actinomadura rubrisoli TaxID=2530368 RepID=A0A4R5B5Y6_9ACTN|nr:pyrroloquinoline quinone precursor peptide PqqA [Actinomadura rubrisoli]TDD80413.1 pyrroloquinoline quinone precursor peptide PqqA [Actinomadura rubrisoli]
MREQSPDTVRTDDRADGWVTPGYEVVETSMEVTAYFRAEI